VRSGLKRIEDKRTERCNRENPPQGYWSRTLVQWKKCFKATNGINLPSLQNKLSNCEATGFTAD
jgi:hypothetical protein